MSSRSLASLDLGDMRENPDMFAKTTLESGGGYKNDGRLRYYLQKVMLETGGGYKNDGRIAVLTEQNPPYLVQRN